MTTNRPDIERYRLDAQGDMAAGQFTTEIPPARFVALCDYVEHIEARMEGHTRIDGTLYRVGPNEPFIDGKIVAVLEPVDTEQEQE